MDRTRNFFESIKAIAKRIWELVMRPVSHLLDLSAELRLFIWEQSPIKTTYTTFTVDASGIPAVLLAIRYPHRGFLQLNRQIAGEADPILNQLTKECGPTRLLIHHQHLDQVHWALVRLRYAQPTDQPLLMEQYHRNICTAIGDEGGILDHVQIQMWSRLANLYTNRDIEVGVWVEPGTSLDSLFTNAHAHPRRIVDPQWNDWESTFTAVFDWPEIAALGDERDPEDVFGDFERHMAVVRHPTVQMLKDQWGVESFGEAFRRAARDQPRNRAQEMATEAIYGRLKRFLGMKR